MKLATVALLLACTLTLTSCSPAWLTTADSILAAAAPALINILQIYAIAEGKPQNGALASKINGDAAELKNVLADYYAASDAAKPGICPQVQAALNVYEEDLPAVLAVAQVSDKNTAAKISTVAALIVGVFGSIEPLIPGCSAPTAPAVKSMTAAKGLQPAPMPLKQFISSYNATLVVPTGNPTLDKETPKMKLHEHSKLVRYGTLGLMK